ncbi:hypothetical protein GIV14_23670 [Pseudomonas syringae]|nr:hypothetical protein [Pseudomonas syringae]
MIEPSRSIRRAAKLGKRSSPEPLLTVRARSLRSASSVTFQKKECSDPTHTLYPFPPHPHPTNKARYPPIAHIKE